MKIKWFPPLDRLFGLVSEVFLDHPVPVGQVLSQLKDEEPDFAPFARFSPGDRQPHGLMVWRQGLVLTLADLVEPEDEVEMIIMVAGG